MKRSAKVLIGFGVLALASPLGLWLPAKFKAGSAWGEWGSDEIKELVGYVPEGFEKLSSLWHAPLHDYAFRGMEHAGIGHLSLAYIFSATIGIALCIAGGFLAGKLLSGKRRHGADKK
jgi:hypothetical protein